jgi:hypothetical protein
VKPVANIYQGPSSCYAKKEGVWVPGSGVNEETLPAFIALILRDYKRGWTYDHNCDRIPMTDDLAVKRLNYLITLAKKHSGPFAQWLASKSLRDLITRYELPVKTVRLRGRREALDRIAKEIESLLGVKVVKEYVGEEKEKRVERARRAAEA